MSSWGSFQSSWWANCQGSLRLHCNLFTFPALLFQLLASGLTLMIITQRLEVATRKFCYQNISHCWCPIPFTLVNISFSLWFFIKNIGKRYCHPHNILIISIFSVLPLSFLWVYYILYFHCDIFPFWIWLYWYLKLLLCCDLIFIQIFRMNTYVSASLGVIIWQKKSES